MVVELSRKAIIEIERNDELEKRERILSITPEERRRLKINKSTLWYQQKSIREGKRIKLYKKTKRILSES